MSARSIQIVLDMTLWNDDLDPEQVAEGLFDHLHATEEWGPDGVSVDGWDVR